MTQTASSQNIGDLFSVFDPQTRQALRSMLQDTGGGVGGHAADLRDVLRTAPEMLPDLGAVSRAVAANDGKDLAMLSTANRLASRFADNQTQLTQLLDRTATTLDALGVDDGEPLADTVNAAPDTLRSAREGLRSVHTPLVDAGAAMALLRPGPRRSASRHPTYGPSCGTGSPRWTRCRVRLDRQIPHWPT